MCSGVSKSGSPAPKPQTSIPSDFIAFALLSMESVRDGVKLEALEESCIKDCFRTTWASRSFQPRNSERVAKSRRAEAEFRIQPEAIQVCKEDQDLRGGCYSYLRVSSHGAKRLQ